jgi:hypothetical protein
MFMKPGFFRWWNTAPVVALDLTNPEVVAWFVHRLRALQAATGVDGFKFDAGVRGWPHPSLKSRLLSHSLSMHTAACRKVASALKWFRPSACCDRCIWNEDVLSWLNLMLQPLPVSLPSDF